LVKLVPKLEEKGKEDGHPLQNFIITLDKRQYNPKEVPEQDEFDDDGTQQMKMDKKP
jgi:hypothetical protein